ncbi:MAG: FkbM family methyltransferase [Bacteroidia bacterium]|jgi:FkbM family methyltransferase|nr:FkbM family methyltransferase [Bacteroidia bacterium]
MINRIFFSIRQRIFWSGVRKKQAAWKLLPQDGRRVEITPAKGLRMVVETGNELSAAIYCGSFEWAEREWLKRYLAKDPSTVFFDIGANIGLMSLLAAERVQFIGDVVAFEPVQSTYEKLRHNISLNPHLKNIETVRIALSDQNGEQEIYLTGSGRDAWNSLVPAEGMQSETIVTARLDELMKDEALELPRPSLMKIDVEGWEIHVLRGATETLRQYRPVMLIEFTAANLEAAGAGCRQLADEVIAHGYTLHEYNPGTRKLQPVNDFTFEHKNLIALPVQE